MLIFTSWKRPGNSCVTFSRMGVSCRHGAHQGAQKSTTTGRSSDARITSASNFGVVVSEIHGDDAATAVRSRIIAEQAVLNVRLENQCRECRVAPATAKPRRV